MRDTQELIAELDEESLKHWFVAIVIGFENTTTFVESKDPDRLQVLNDAMSVGGQPIGLIAADQANKQLNIMTKIYPENADWQEQARAYLGKLTVEVGKLISNRKS
jgi:hypothetical protein